MNFVFYYEKTTHCDYVCMNCLLLAFRIILKFFKIEDAINSVTRWHDDTQIRIQE